MPVVRLNGKSSGPRPPKPGTVQAGASEWDVLRAYRNLGQALFLCDGAKRVEAKLRLERLQAMPRCWGRKPASWDYLDAKLMLLGKAWVDGRRYAVEQGIRELLPSTKAVMAR
jgi:hypothetical protein